MNITKSTVETKESKKQYWMNILLPVLEVVITGAVILFGGVVLGIGMIIGELGHSAYRMAAK